MQLKKCNHVVCLLNKYEYTLAKKLADADVSVPSRRYITCTLTRWPASWKYDIISKNGLR